MTTTYFFDDTTVLLGRSLRHITRSLDTIITVAITPIAIMLLFVYVFGGAISQGSDRYVSYMLPGILLITIAMGVSYTAVRLFTDMKSGIFERFQSMPIARSSSLWAHVLTSLVSNLISLVLVVLVALLIGFRSGAGVQAWLAVAPSPAGAGTSSFPTSVEVRPDGAADRHAGTTNREM
jgi:ABC-2 type transport system permease protein